MSITSRRSEQRTESDRQVIDNFQLDPEGVEGRCFYCSELVRNPAILWAGAAGVTIYLHPSCARLWSTHLLTVIKCETAKRKAVA